MNKFKIGDRVRCVDAGNHHLIKNKKEYVVEGPGFALNGPDPLIQLEGVKDYLGFFESRFELVKKSFNIETATDQELADEVRRLWEQYAPVARALKNKGYSLAGYGVGDESNVYYKVSKKVEQEINL